jgi:hypothetical protein
MDSSSFDVELPNWITHETGKRIPLRVVAEVSDCEPDIGLTVLEVYCSEDGYDPKENIIECFDQQRIDDIAHEIYQAYY